MCPLRMLCQHCGSVLITLRYTTLTHSCNIGAMLSRSYHSCGVLTRIFGKRLSPIPCRLYLTYAFPRGSQGNLNSTSKCLLFSDLGIAKFSSSGNLSFDNPEDATIDDVEKIATIGRELLDGQRQCKDGDIQKYLTAAANLGHVDSAFLLGTYLMEKSSVTAVTEAVPQSDEQMSPESRAAVVKKEIKDATQTARTEKKIRIQKQKNSMPIQASEDVKVSDADLGLEWLRWASRKNHGGAMCYLGNILLAKENADDNLEAVLWYEKAVNLTNPSTDALFNLGTLYFNGREDVIKQDLLKSFSYFKRAADLGDSSSQFWIGYCYFTGEGVDGIADGPVRPQLALRYLKSCSETGHSSALYYLATLYRSGLSSSVQNDLESENIAPNKELFLKYLLMAVEAEDPDALFCLGDLYLNSSNNLEFDDYFPRDEKKGRELYLKASDLGHVEVCGSFLSLS